MSKLISKSKVIEQDLVEYILTHNALRSTDYTNPSAQLSRQLYRAQHPTEILVAKCMDGRLNLGVYTEVPPGILQPFRNVGGKFDLGWPFYQEVIRDTVDYAITKGRGCLLVSSYHFSKSDTHRGCAGFGYDTDAAKNAALELKNQYTHVYGDAVGRPVYGLMIGIETDEESLVFHGVQNDTLKVADFPADSSEVNIKSQVEKLYPDMDPKMHNDLVPLIAGNIRHIAKVRASNKEPIDLEHREQIIAVGRGFDWLHQPNRALIVGPYSHSWPTAVKTAGTIALSNLKEGRIPTEYGVLLLVAALWRSDEREVGRRLKEEKVRYLRKTAEDVLRSEVPDLVPHLHVLGGVVDADTRKFHPMN